jgi:hypothetical protein
MTRKEIKWDFNQLFTGLEAFVADIELKLRNIIEDLPTFIITSGDQSYIFNEKFVESQEKEIYLKVPRMTFTFDDIQYQLDQYSNQYNKLTYFFENKNYECVCRRLPLMVPITTNLVSSNLISTLENFEIMATVASRENVFTYEFMGNTFESAYSLQSPSMENPVMDASSATRYFNIKTMFELQLHILVPRVQTIKEFSDKPYQIKTDIDVAKDTPAVGYKSSLDNPPI